MIRFNPIHLLRNSLFIAALALPICATAQRTAKVTGKYQFIVTDNDNITLKEAKIKAIDLAKAEALKNEFGVMVMSDYINSERGTEDDSNSFYVMDTSSSVKGEWLGDEKDPVITIETANGNLIFTAEVWGSAREIIRANTELKWDTTKEVNGERVNTDTYNNKERIYLDFKSPIDGYVAIYLITADDQASRLLPYRKDNSGSVFVKGGKTYTFFDKTTDSEASHYNLSTNEIQEMDQLVVIFSPHSFTKYVDSGSDSRRPNQLSQKDLAKWLLKNQRSDKDMVVNRKWITINGEDVP